VVGPTLAGTVPSVPTMVAASPVFTGRPSLLFGPAFVDMEFSCLLQNKRPMLIAKQRALGVTEFINLLVRQSAVQS
jgi:hypothetical protein